MKKVKQEPAVTAEPVWMPSRNETKALTAHFTRQAENYIGPRIKVVQREQQDSLTVDHPHPRIGAELLRHAFGTVDPDFQAGLVHQLADVSRTDAGVDERELNFLSSVVKSIKPRDELESMLAAQMAAVHSASMKAAGRLARADDMPRYEVAQRAFNKLTRTFSMQLEALKRHRSNGEQKVTVQHIDLRGG